MVRHFGTCLVSEAEAAAGLCIRLRVLTYPLIVSLQPCDHEFLRNLRAVDVDRRIGSFIARFFFWS